MFEVPIHIFRFSFVKTHDEDVRFQIEIYVQISSVEQWYKNIEDLIYNNNNLLQLYPDYNCL